jgi:serine/threonine protein kinase
MLMAVAHLHSLKIAHTDLRPANVLLAGRRSRGRSACRPTADGGEGETQPCRCPRCCCIKIVGLGRARKGRSRLREDVNDLRYALRSTCCAVQALIMLCSASAQHAVQCKRVCARACTPNCAGEHGCSPGCSPSMHSICTHDLCTHDLFSQVPSAGDDSPSSHIHERC